MTPWSKVSDGHRSDAARRYAVKMFLQDIYEPWKLLEGLTPMLPYQESHLGKKHGVIPV